MSTQRVKQDESPPSAGPVVSHDDGDDQDDNSVYFDADEASNVDIDELAESSGIFRTTGEHLDTAARLDENGQVKVTLHAKYPLPDLPPPNYIPDDNTPCVPQPQQIPRLNIVIFIVGSRGDVQPYLAAAVELINTYGHRVRLATHDCFEGFVLDQRGLLDENKRDNLEFYPVGGDPKELMAYMVKNPGLLPGRQSIFKRDVPKKQAMVNQMLRGFYRSTFFPCPQTDLPFAVDVIISNPPAFAHIHVAEALGVPLIMTFKTRLRNASKADDYGIRSGLRLDIVAMPWSPTTEFSHPLVAVEQSNTPKRLKNYLTYALADGLTWQGLGRGVNHFRRRKLGLAPLTSAAGSTVVDRLRVPFLYCWSSALIPKPADWMQNIEVTGFLFLENKTYVPPDDLKSFLKEESGERPIYIGFGSIVVADPEGLTDILLAAIEKSGVRALISVGWSGLGNRRLPPNIFPLGDVPHDWLFAENRVAAVCIHGGAGTTAIALRNGVPVIVVPFFGDQSFWGAMIARRGAGPEPIKYKDLNSENLAMAFRQALSEEARSAAHDMGSFIRDENGASKFVSAFHSHLPLLNMRCDIQSDLVAVWWSRKYALRLSGLVAEVLIQNKKLSADSLQLWRPMEHDVFIPATDPVSGGSMAVLRAVTDLGEGFLRIFSARPYHGLYVIMRTGPRVVSETLFGITEGLETMPSLWGTVDRRQRTKVTGAVSGLVAAGQGLVYGFYDGFTALAVDPYLGARKEGILGFAKGLGRGIMNSGFQPLAGVSGALTHPINGMAKSLRKSFRKEAAETVLIAPRRASGRSAAQSVDSETKKGILDHFKILSENVKERKQAMKVEAKRRARDFEVQAKQDRRQKGKA